jgi:hypothetical protein
MKYTGTVDAVERTEQDMIALLWEGFALVTHNTRRNGHINLRGVPVPSFTIRQYEVCRPAQAGDHSLEMVIPVVFEYNRPLNRGRIRILERDMERLEPML